MLEVLTIKSIVIVIIIHRTKSHVSVFLKHDGNMQLHRFRYVSVLRKRANSSLRDSVTFPERKCQKVVRFRCDRSNGDVSKRHETANGNTGYPSCFRIGFTCFCRVSVYGFLDISSCDSDTVMHTHTLLIKRACTHFRKPFLELNLGLKMFLRTDLNLSCHIVINCQSVAKNAKNTKLIY